ncbi:MAG: polysaccharide deacetylase family protein [Thermoflexales bacterium]
MKGVHQAVVASFAVLTIFLLALTSSSPPPAPSVAEAHSIATLDPTVVNEATAFAAAPPTVESLGAEAMAGDLSLGDDLTAETASPPQDLPDLRTPTPALVPALSPTPPRPTPAFTPMSDPEDNRIARVPPTATLAPVAPLRTPETVALQPAAPPVAVVTGAAGVREARVPILMYHYLSVPPPDADRIRIDLSVSPAMFEQQLAYLKENGYTTISLGDLFDALAGGRGLPAKPVILTFDDGYRDAYENALPLLKKYGMRATFFIVTDFIHAGHPAYLTWPMVQALNDSGMSIENHTRSHADLRRRDDDFLVWQILGAIESIKAYTGKRPQFFCYPGGFFDDNTVRVARSANMLAAVTTQYGKTHSLGDAMVWSRVRVRGEGTLRDFADLVR